MVERLTNDLKESLHLDDESLGQIANYAESLSGTQLEKFLSEFLGNGSVITERYLFARGEREKTMDHHVSESDSNTSGLPSDNPQGLCYTKGVWESESSKKQQLSKYQNKRYGNKLVSKTKVKVDSLNDIDAALRQLEFNDTKLTRKACQCMGQRHPLLEVAPNCLGCGKVICTKEGLGSCTFCGEALISNSQLEDINRILMSEKDTLTSSMGKKARQKAGVDNGQTVSTLGVKNYGSRQAVSEAQGRLNQLLEYQDTAAQRTKIIDQVGDFETPDSGLNKWASPMEQAQQLKRQQKQMRKLEQRRLERSGRGKKVISIDLKGNKVYAEEREDEDEDEEEDEVGEKGPDNEEKKQQFFSNNKRASTWIPSEYGKNFIQPLYKAEYIKQGEQYSELDKKYHGIKGGVVEPDAENDENRALEL